MSTGIDESPVFVLTGARSGSTLLRHILDAHPDIACPPETNLGPAFTSISMALRRGLDSDDGEADTSTIAVCRILAARTLGGYARRTGKVRWAEKSLSTPYHLDVICQVFPEARFICLYRECRDTISSLLEASPYGYGAFGLEPYVRECPTNLIAAAGMYWVDRAERLLQVEQQYAGQCFRLRYEDLVGQPEVVLPSLFGFLDIRWEPMFIRPEKVFDARRRGQTGDFKIWYEQTISARSVGRGKRLPMSQMPMDVGKRINALSDELDYQPLQTVDERRVELATKITPDDARPDTRHAVPFVVERGDQLSGRSGLLSGDATISSAAELFATRVRGRLGHIYDVSQVSTMRVTICDIVETWLLDFENRVVMRSEAPSECTIALDNSTLLAIANGDVHPGIALKDGRLRLETIEHPVLTERQDRHQFFRYIDAFLHAVT